MSHPHQQPPQSSPQNVMHRRPGTLSPQHSAAPLPQEYEYSLQTPQNLPEIFPSQHIGQQHNPNVQPHYPETNVPIPQKHPTHYQPHQRQSGISYSFIFRYLLVAFILLSNLVILWSYYSLPDCEKTVQDHHIRIQELEKIVSDYKELERVKSIEPSVVRNGVHDQAGANDSLETVNSSSHAGAGIPIGAGRGYHNHTYETIHYEFILDTKTQVWEKYPPTGKLPYMSLERLLFFHLCCRAEMGEYVCADTRALEARVIRDYETQDQYLRVRFSDMSLAGKMCTLTFTLDVHPDR